MAASTTFTKSSLRSLCRSFLQKRQSRSPTSFKHSRLLSFSSHLSSNKNINTDDKLDSEPRDPFPVFCDARVQELLVRITGFDLMKIAGPNLVQLSKPVYKLLTHEQLVKEQIDAVERMKEKLQMPPYMGPRKPPKEPLSVDPDLANYDTCKYVFTDVTFGVNDRERLVTVREVDGTLNMAPWDVRERLNQIYNPREGRKMVKPAMFEEHNLERMIKQKKYEYILDRACCQFEPDDPDFIRASHRVYNAIDSCGDYQLLWSTRHFGPLAFYLSWHCMLDGLLAHMLDSDKQQDASDTVHLYCIIYPDSACAAAVSQLAQPQGLEVVKAYLSTDCKNKDQLDLSIKACEEASMRLQDSNK